MRRLPLLLALTCAIASAAAAERETRIADAALATAAKLREAIGEFKKTVTV